MTHVESNDLIYLLDLALGIAKDKAFEDALRAVQSAQREYLKADADTRRVKTRAIIQQMAELDSATYKLRHEYDRIQPILTPNARAHFENSLRAFPGSVIFWYRKKKSLPSALDAPPIGSEHINGVRLIPGDILAAGRKSGLYQHFAVYTGADKVIHYAAEGGDFAGRITIHEAPLSEFQADSTFIYVLEFPDDCGYPSVRTPKGILPRQVPPEKDLSSS